MRVVSLIGKSSMGGDGGPKPSKVSKGDGSRKCCLLGGCFGLVTVSSLERSQGFVYSSSNSNSRI